MRTKFDNADLKKRNNIEKYLNQWVKKLYRTWVIKFFFSQQTKDANYSRNSSHD